MNFEYVILDFINKTQSPYLTQVMKFFTHIADAGFIWIVLCIFLLMFKKTRKIGVCIAIALIMDFIIVNLILKPLINRPRPFMSRDIAVLIKAPIDASFPSGHSAASFAASFSVYLYNRKYGVLLMILSSLIALSRLYFYVHFPSDVVCGILLGIGFSYISYKIQNRYLI